MRRKRAEERNEVAAEEGTDLLDLPPVTDAEAAWKLKARCRGLRWYEYSTKQQKEICQTCTVVQECRALADLVETTKGFKGPESHVGVWGRESPADRRKRREFIARLHPEGGLGGSSRH